MLRMMAPVQALNAGYRARADGVSLSRNPFVVMPSMQFVMWERGWCSRDVLLPVCQRREAREREAMRVAASERECDREVPF